jgi:predicted permease
MKWMLWTRDILKQRGLDSELDEELKDHIARETEENMAKGVSYEEAHRRALRDFGQLQETREDCRRQRHGQWLDSVLQDIRFALRMLHRNKTFTIVAVATLAIGIGANTAIFSLVYATLVRPLPYGSTRIVAFTSNQSFPDITDIGRASKTMEHLGVYGDWPFEMRDQYKPIEVKGAIVGGDIFPALAVQPAIGRYFTEADNDARTPVAVVSNAYWRGHLNGDPQVLGRKITLSGTVYEIVGVMPEGFRFPRGESQVWVPFTVAYPEAVEARGAHFLFGLGSLRPGMTLAQAKAELSNIGAELARLHPEEARTFNVVPLRERIVGSLRTPLLILYGAVTMVLLIACVNFSSLLLSRTAARQREFHIRVSLGARRLRIIRQMLTESLVVAILAAAAGLGVAGLAVRSLLELKPKDITGMPTGTFSAGTFLFALGLAILCGLLFGVAPAIQFLRASASLREGPRTSSVRKKRRFALIVAECALAVLLLSGAGLLIRSFWKIVNVEPGFNPHGLLTMRLNLPPSRYQEISTQVMFLNKLDRELQAVPEVEAAGIVSELPLAGSHMEHNFVIRGTPEVPVGEEPELSAHEASPRYFATMQIPVIAGRVFSENDVLTSPAVAVITRSMAEQYFPGESAIGAQVAWARAPQKHWMTIVGVVGDVHHDGLDGEAMPALYTPLAQKQMPWKRGASIVVRTRAADPLLSANAVEDAVLRTDPQLPVTFVESMTTVMAESLAERRFTLILLCAFASVALVLAMIGIYGVISYLVSQRTQEIGVRMALGAQRSRVLAMIMSEGLSMTAAGVLIGALAGFLLLRVGQGMLYGITTNDPIALGGAAVVLLAVAGIACFFPARRAAKIDPMNALRVD